MSEAREGAPPRYRAEVQRPWALVTDGAAGNSRSALAAVRALADGGYRPAVTVSGGVRASLAASSRYCERVVRVPPATDAAFARAVEEVGKSGPVVAVVPASDAALLALGSPAVELVDKVTLGERATAAGLAVPPTRLFESGQELLEAAETLSYPLVVKGAIALQPAFRADDPAGVVRALTDQSRFGSERIVVQPFLTEGRHAVCGVVWEGRLVAAAHQRYLRTWPPDCGTASFAVTAPHDPQIENKLLRLLAGYQGIFQAQFAGPRLHDLNLRAYGSLPLAVAAGANLPSIYCDLCRGVEVATIRARPGVYFRWLEGDIRFAIRAVGRRDLPPTRLFEIARPRWGSAHSTESIRDPRPMLARLRQALGRGR